jgi:urease accessory protein
MATKSRLKARNDHCMSPTAPPTEAWHGRATLRFSAEPAGATRVQGGATAPLKLLRHFSTIDGRCDVPLLHTAGGLVGGDALSIALQLGANSRALISSVAAQKIYGSRHRSRVQPQGRWAQIRTESELAAGAELEWLPQETVVFAGALLEVEHNVVLAAGASWLGMDVVRLGRTARGETLEDGCWRNRLNVRRDGRWLLVDRLELGGESLESSHGLDGQPVVGSLVWAAPGPVEPQAMATLLEGARWDRSGLMGSMAISPLEPGLIARYRGSSTQAARFWFFRIWCRIRAMQQQAPPSWPRYWPFQERDLAISPAPATPTTTAAR